MNDNELYLHRGFPSAKSTIGRYSLNGLEVCFCIEDVDRGVNDSMTVKEIQAVKIYGETAIPAGRYKFFWRQSPTHGLVPQLIGVKGFAYIQIHSANFASQLLGCQAPGMSAGVDSVSSSRDACKKLYKFLRENGVEYINVISSIKTQIT